MLITDPYRALQRQLHATTEYGVTAPKFMDQIRDMARAYAVRSILDYGSGPREHVKNAIGGWYDVRSYDPCVPGLDCEPAPADMLVSCDVLEHIEPRCLEDVLEHMEAMTRKAAFLTIATGPAGKTLADGRNAHLIQAGAEFWLPRILERWRLLHFVDIGPELVCVCGAKA